LRCLAACVAIFGVGVGVGAAHAAVKFDPEISFGIAHTDNLELASSDGEIENVYELIPAFRLEQESTRVSSKMAYRLESYYYKNRSDSDVYHILDATVRTALDPDNFFVDIGATQDQVIRDPAAPIALTNLPITTNRLEQSDVFIMPNFRYAFGTNLTTTGSLRHDRVRYGAEANAFVARNFDEDLFAYSIDNFRKLMGFTWAVRFQSDKADYGVARPWEYRRASVELGSWVGPRVRLFASGGKESPWDSLDPSLEDSFWELGVATRQTDKLSAEFAVGDRSFGSSRRGSLTLKLRNGNTGFSYTEEPASLGREKYRGGLLSTEQSPDLLLRPGAAERFLLKRAQWQISMQLTRADFTVQVFDESREGRTTLDGVQLPDETQSGGSASATWHAGVRTDFVLRIEHSIRDVGDGDDRAYSLASLAANHRLGTRTRVALQYARTKEESNSSGPGLNYQANLVTLMLTRTF
jgi:uncharacterized protein (PEP-CTERM system associated)